MIHYTKNIKESIHKSSLKNIQWTRRQTHHAYINLSSINWSFLSWSIDSSSNLVSRTSSLKPYSTSQKQHRTHTFRLLDFTIKSLARLGPWAGSLAISITFLSNGSPGTIFQSLNIYFIFTLTTSHTNWGKAAPLVATRSSVSKPNESMMGINAWRERKGVPALYSSYTINTRRAIYTLNITTTMTQ